MAGTFNSTCRPLRRKGATCTILEFACSGNIDNIGANIARAGTTWAGQKVQEFKEEADANWMNVDEGAGRAAAPDLRFVQPPIAVDASAGERPDHLRPRPLPPATLDEMQRDAARA